jgi:transcription elongation factor S-II
VAIIPQGWYLDWIVCRASGGGWCLTSTPTSSAAVSIGPSTGDTLRDKVRQKFAALEWGDGMFEDGAEADEAKCKIACDLEDALFELYGGVTSQDYKTKFRSLSFNLSDANNIELRSKVAFREITAFDLVRMDAKDLASEAKKKAREEALKYEIDKVNQNYDEDKLESSGNYCDLFKCGKCGKSKTRFRQMQTRSADEPMTTFIQCLVCKNKWKQY